MLRAPPPRTRVVPNGSEVWTFFRKLLWNCYKKSFYRTILTKLTKQILAHLCTPDKHDENVCVSCPLLTFQNWIYDVFTWDHLWVWGEIVQQHISYLRKINPAGKLGKVRKPEFVIQTVNLTMFICARVILFLLSRAYYVIFWRENMGHFFLKTEESTRK